MIQTHEIRYKLLRNGVEYGEIYSGENSPTLMCDSGGDIKMSLRGTFLSDAYDVYGNKVEVDWLADEIKPVLVIDGVENPLGILMPSTVNPTEENGNRTIQLQAYDRCWRVKDNKVEGSVYLTAGTNYVEAIMGLLISCGVYNVTATRSNATLTENREDWQTGESYLKIINDLLSEINYKQLWFNENGFAMLEPQSTPSGENIKHVFTDSKKDPRNKKEVSAISVYPKLSRTTDVYQAPNVFICVCSNADKSTVMKATAENTNPNSPLSIMRRGRRIVKVVNVNNIASQAELEAYTNKLLYDSMTTGEIIQIETQLLPGFGVDDVSAVLYKDVLGVCVEKSWSMELTPGGTMTHTLEKVVINLD